MSSRTSVIAFSSFGRVALPFSPKNTSSGRARMSPTFMRGLSEASGFWNTYWIARRSAGGRVSISGDSALPSNWMVPAFGATSPHMARAMVDLPDPDSPIRASVSLRAMVRSTPRTTVDPSDAPIPRTPRRRP